jgi:regulator of protease activity HflC (stomatin/prohibitin superfamily)
MQKVDIRIKTVDVPEQEAITKDNIPVAINAVIFYKVMDPNKALFGWLIIGKIDSRIDTADPV